MKRLYKMLIVLAAVVALGVYFLIFQTGSNNDGDSTAQDSASSSEYDYDIDLDILENSRFSDLKIFSDLPVQSGETGNENPIVN